MSVEISSEMLSQNLLYDLPVKYNDAITLYPIRMMYIFKFRFLQMAITVRKDSIFQRKDVIKMSYWEFIKNARLHPEAYQSPEVPLLSSYYSIILDSFSFLCPVETTVEYNQETLDVYLNKELITDDIFDDIRRIIIIQNDIDFNLDEFMNLDTVHALERARAFEAKKNNETADIEDYIDSLVIDLKSTNEYVMNLTVRKFWRYIKRINKHEQYNACLNGQMSGMATFKEPLKHWMTSIEVDDKYADVKTDESELREKIG